MLSPIPIPAAAPAAPPPSNARSPGDDQDDGEAFSALLEDDNQRDSEVGDAAKARQDTASAPDGGLTDGDVDPDQPVPQAAKDDGDLTTPLDENGVALAVPETKAVATDQPVQPQRSAANAPADEVLLPRQASVTADQATSKVREVDGGLTKTADQAPPLAKAALQNQVKATPPAATGRMNASTQTDGTDQPADADAGGPEQLRDLRPARPETPPSANGKSTAPGTVTSAEARANAETPKSLAAPKGGPSTATTKEELANNQNGQGGAAAAKAETSSKPPVSSTLGQAIVEHRAARSRIEADGATRQSNETARTPVKAAFAYVPKPETVETAAAKVVAGGDASTLVNRDVAEPLAKLDPASPAFERPAPSALPTSSSTTATTPADQARQIAQQLAAAVPGTLPGTTEITLQPEELGRVRMTLTVQDGALTLIIQADRSDTSDLMRRHIDQLAQAYRQMGFDTLSFSFAGSAQDPDQDGETPTAQADGDSDGLDAPETAANPSLPTAPLGRLDLRI